jgi:endonuclease YncB( thermonuclease family)
MLLPTENIQKKFVKDEEFAKENNKGMWSMSFEYPWEYRKKN